METQVLREKDIYPSDEVIQKALGESFPVYKEFMETITDKENVLIPQWRYYMDGKAWLCKVVYKNKTVFWLSVWEGFFKLGFYFTEKNSPGVTSLDIEQSHKESFQSAKTFGKLKPLIFKVTKKEQINDVMKVIGYKKSLK